MMNPTTAPTTALPTRPRRAPGRGMLADQFDPHRNSLNALRLVLALLVIVSHAPPAMGTGEPYQWADLDVGGWAVAGFFAISGWLITGSRLHLDLRAFVWRRLLRIVPAFWLCLLVTAVVLVPASAALLGESPSPSATLGYAVRNAGIWIVQPTVTGSLVDAYEPAWNLSLWTLFWEVCCYLGVGLLLTMGRARHDPRIVAALALLAVVGNTVVRTTELIEPGSPLGAGLRLGSFFLAGAALRLYADRVPARPALALLAGCVLAILSMLGLVGALGQVPVAYLCLYAAMILPLQRVGATNDLSYGVYLYGFPVAHLVATLGFAQMGPPTFIIATMIAVVPVTAVSWFVVERRAMKWKRLVPARAALDHTTGTDSGGIRK